MINPARTALLVMDFQPVIVAGIPGADQVLRRVEHAVAAARAKGVTIGHVRVAFEDTDWDAIPPANKIFAGTAQARSLHHRAPEAQFHERLTPAHEDIVVRKTRVGGFSTTDLDEQLRGRNIDTLVLAGLSTSGVVLSTLRDAADRDYRLYVLSDGSADRDTETHEVLTQRVFPRQADVVTIEEFEDLLSRC